MSYILDALQRADTERERGTVPGLHAQPLAAPTRQRDRWPRSTLWMLLLVACGVAALLAGWWFGRGSTSPMATTPAPAVRLGTPPAAPPPLPTVAVVTPMPPAPVAAVAAVSSPVTPPAAAPHKATTMPNDPPKAPAAAASAPLPWLAELPEETRRQIATLAITGAVYSNNPGQRLLLVNGQVLPQGSPVVPEVTLEEIREHHSVFSFRGSRFRLAH